VIIEPKIFWYGTPSYHHRHQVIIIIGARICGWNKKGVFNHFSLALSNFSLFHSWLPLLVCFFTCLKCPLLMALDGCPRETQGRRDSKSRQSNAMLELCRLFGIITVDSKFPQAWITGISYNREKQRGTCNFCMLTHGFLTPSYLS